MQWGGMVFGMEFDEVVDFGAVGGMEFDEVVDFCSRVEWSLMRWWTLVQWGGMVFGMEFDEVVDFGAVGWNGVWDGV